MSNVLIALTCSGGAAGEYRLTVSEDQLGRTLASLTPADRAFLLGILDFQNPAEALDTTVRRFVARRTAEVAIGLPDIEETDPVGDLTGDDRTQLHELFLKLRDRTSPTEATQNWCDAVLFLLSNTPPHDA
jgi:hypothetical protein